MVQFGDELGQLDFSGFDGVDYERAAQIRIRADGTPSLDDVPDSIELRTAPSGGGGVQTRMIIDDGGNVGIGTTSPQSALQVNGYIQLALTSGTPPPQIVIRRRKQGA